MQQIKVDPVGLEAAQAALAGGDGRPAGRVVRIDLAHQEHLVASVSDRLGDEFLGPALAIHLGGIDQGEAEVETEPERCNLLRAARPVLRHVPSPQAERRHALTR